MNKLPTDISNPRQDPALKNTQMGQMLPDVTTMSEELWSAKDKSTLLRKLVRQMKNLGARVEAGFLAADSRDVEDLAISLSETRVLEGEGVLALQAMMSSAHCLAESLTTSVKVAVTDDWIGSETILPNAHTSVPPAPGLRLLIGCQFGARSKKASSEQAIVFLLKQFYHVWVWVDRFESTERLVYRDDLTDLYNNRYLKEMLEKEVARAKRFGLVFSLFFIDLDNLKRINDTVGHLVGTKVLQRFAELLREELRQVDSIVRYGGDEFIVLLLGAEGDAAKMVAERIRHRMEQEDFSGSGVSSQISVTCSIGIACFPEHATTGQDLLKLSDLSMYESKNNGKNKVSMAVGPSK